MSSEGAKLQATWARLGIDPDRLGARVDGTIRPIEPTDTLPSQPNSTLSAQLSAQRVEQAARLEPGLCAENALTGQSTPIVAESSGIVARLGTEEVVLRDEVLGEGGMGKIWLARQRSLERDVAVKGLQDMLDTPIGRAQLLREARVTGALEHPNIIPVHALVEGATGEPLMVMKRVEGTAWTQRIAEMRDTKAHLETHLRLLMQVCHAVHFAHARGVLHRDLKPDNVMLGNYGEVYVVDWGIAVALDEETRIPGLPLCSDVKGIVGTIQYMAPEMVAGDGKGLCVQSDVYLLGTILHEIVTGRPRHIGEAVPQVLHAAWQSVPYQYGVDVPEEIASLLNRSMHRDTAKRPATAEAFRREIEAFLAHQASADLAEQAERRLVAARQMRQDQLDATAALREARFGFLQALRLWPQNEPARVGLQEVLSVLIERAIGDANLTGARQLLSDMAPNTQSRWHSQVESLSRQVAKRKFQIARLEQERRDADLSPSSKPRRVFGVGFAIAFALVNVGLDFWDRQYGVSWPIYLLATGGAAGVFLIPLMVLYKRLFPTRAAKRLSVSVAVMLFGQASSFTAFMMVGLELRTSLALSLLPLATVVGAKSALIEPRMWWAGALAIAAGIIGLLFPSLVFYAVAIAYAAYFVGGVLLHYDDFLDETPRVQP